MTSNSEIMDAFKQLRCCGDMKYKREIVRKTTTLVYSNCKMYKRYPNYEDLVQEGFVGLIRAVNMFNPNKFPNFFVYADRWILHYVKRSASRFDIVYNPHRIRVVYSEPDENDFIPEDNPEHQLLIKEEKEILYKEINKLSPKESSIIKKTFGVGEKPKTLRAVALQFNISPERVRQIRNDIVAKLKKTLSSHGDL